MKSGAIETTPFTLSCEFSKRKTIAKEKKNGKYFLLCLLRYIRSKNVGETRYYIHCSR